MVFFHLSAMFSLFELETLCGDEEKLRKFLESYGVLKDVPTCEDLLLVC